MRLLDFLVFGTSSGGGNVRASAEIETTVESESTVES